MKFLREWILAENWCRSVSRLYLFNNATGQVTVKHTGFYWVYGQVNTVLQCWYTFIPQTMHSLEFNCEISTSRPHF